MHVELAVGLFLDECGYPPLEQSQLDQATRDHFYCRFVRLVPVIAGFNFRNGSQLCGEHDIVDSLLFLAVTAIDGEGASNVSGVTLVLRAGVDE